MDIKLKDYIYIIYIALLPFTLTLIILRLNRVGLFTSKIYYYIILLCSVITLITFVWSLLYTLDDIIYKEDMLVIRNMKLAILLFVSPLYIPIHYVCSNYRKYSFISIILVSIMCASLYYSLTTFNKYNLKIQESFDKQDIVIKDHFDYYFDYDTFVVNIDFNYVCQKEKGDYRLFCDNKLDDSFIGIYSYIIDNYSSDELMKAYKFHIDQTKNYIIEAGYEFNEEVIDDAIRLSYTNNMEVYLKYVEYDLDKDSNNDISLVIIYELTTNEDNINKFNKLVNSIKVNENIEV